MVYGMVGPMSEDYAGLKGNCITQLCFCTHNYCGQSAVLKHFCLRSRAIRAEWSVCLVCGCGLVGFPLQLCKVALVASLVLPLSFMPVHAGLDRVDRCIAMALTDVSQ